MSLLSLRKSVYGIGEIEYKVVSSRKELEQATMLVYKEYLMRGYILPKYYKNNLRITSHHILPGMTTFIGIINNEIVATITLIPDSPLGLPMDQVYKQEVDKLRKEGRSVCEGAYLSIKSEIFGKGLFSMFNLKKIDFMFALFKLMFQYAFLIEKFDDICIVTNPKYLMFKFLPFEPIGKVKYYGYDRIAIKRKAAIPKRMDLRNMRKEYEKIKKNPLFKISYKPVLYKLFLGSNVPIEIFNQKFNFSLDDLKYFFVDKSDVLKNMKESQKNYIRSCYGLTEKQFNEILTPKK